ncbi:hypothetical protein GN244_ATG03780 [Phytophthora infestans]|uniref:Uncharacterized protein n=1 Tax=Phytophthora infestans TaxID=4787 RepID=A0A833SZ75_PHYIN|nr:hypothetical protein GN244_ATG03780 [Phytophthora infestans]
MDADAETRAQLHTRIVVIRPNALLWPQEGEDLDPRLLHCFIPYLLRLAPLTERTGGGNLVPTDTGRYFRIRPEEVGLYKHSYASKWGYTTQEAIARGNQVIREVTTGRGVPEAGLNPMLAVAFAGLPHSRRLPNQLEHGLRNALKRAELRLRYHASGPVPMPRDRTVFSEPFEYAVYRLRGDDLFVVYAAYATQLEEGRRVALETVERMDRQRAQNIRTRRQELQHQFRRAMNQCRAKNRRELIATSAVLSGHQIPPDVVRVQLGGLHADHHQAMVALRHGQALQRAALEAQLQALFRAPHVAQVL